MQQSDETARIPAGNRVYAVGDIHGMAQLLASVFQRIDADIEKFPGVASQEIYLGDFIDRGPESAMVLRMLADRKRKRNVVCIAGNHELYMLQALKNPAAFAGWLDFGGRETLMSYGIQPPRDQAIDAAFEAFAKCVGWQEMYILNYALPVYQLGDYLFVHAGIRPGIPLVQQKITDLTTIRKPFLDSRLAHGVIVVHGHTPVAEVDVQPNRINIDTGAYMSGRLSCLVIEGETLRML